MEYVRIVNLRFVVTCHNTYGWIKRILGDVVDIAEQELPIPNDAL
jgi:hypothetical protein